jgi:hypothetical protein
VVAFMLQEGTANYFKGLMLVLCYLIVGASFFVHMDHKPDHSDGRKFGGQKFGMQHGPHHRHSWG